MSILSIHQKAFILLYLILVCQPATSTFSVSSDHQQHGPKILDASYIVQHIEVGPNDSTNIRLANSPHHAGRRVYTSASIHVSFDQPLFLSTTSNISSPLIPLNNVNNPSQLLGLTRLRCSGGLIVDSHPSHPSSESWPFTLPHHHHKFKSTEFSYILPDIEKRDEDSSIVSNCYRAHLLLSIDEFVPESGTWHHKPMSIISFHHHNGIITSSTTGNRRDPEPLSTCLLEFLPPDMQDWKPAIQLQNRGGGSVQGSVRLDFDQHQQHEKSTKTSESLPPPSLAAFHDLLRTLEYEALLSSASGKNFTAKTPNSSSLPSTATPLTFLELQERYEEPLTALIQLMDKFQSMETMSAEIVFDLLSDPIIAILVPVVISICVSIVLPIIIEFLAPFLGQLLAAPIGKAVSKYLMPPGVVTDDEVYDYVNEYVTSRDTKTLPKPAGTSCPPPDEAAMAPPMTSSFPQPLAPRGFGDGGGASGGKNGKKSAFPSKQEQDFGSPFSEAMHNKFDKNGDLCVTSKSIAAHMREMLEYEKQHSFDQELPKYHFIFAKDSYNHAIVNCVLRKIPPMSERIIKPPTCLPLYKFGFSLPYVSGNLSLAIALCKSQVGKATNLFASMDRSKTNNLRTIDLEYVLRNWLSEARRISTKKNYEEIATCISDGIPATVHTVEVALETNNKLGVQWEEFIAWPSKIHTEAQSLMRICSSDDSTRAMESDDLFKKIGLKKGSTDAGLRVEKYIRNEVLPTMQLNSPDQDCILSSITDLVRDVLPIESLEQDSERVSTTVSSKLEDCRGSEGSWPGAPLSLANLPLVKRAALWDMFDRDGSASLEGDEVEVGLRHLLHLAKREVLTITPRSNRRFVRSQLLNCAEDWIPYVAVELNWHRDLNMMPRLQWDEFRTDDTMNYLHKLVSTLVWECKVKESKLQVSKKVRKKFDEYDINQSGIITAEELKKPFKIITDYYLDKFAYSSERKNVIRKCLNNGIMQSTNHTMGHIDRGGEPGIEWEEFEKNPTAIEKGAIAFYRQCAHESQSEPVLHNSHEVKHLWEQAGGRDLDAAALLRLIQILAGEWQEGERHRLLNSSSSSSSSIQQLCAISNYFQNKENKNSNLDNAITSLLKDMNVNRFPTIQHDEFVRAANYPPHTARLLTTEELKKITNEMTKLTIDSNNNNKKYYCDTKKMKFWKRLMVSTGKSKKNAILNGYLSLMDLEQILYTMLADAQKKSTHENYNMIASCIENEIPAGARKVLKELDINGTPGIQFFEFMTDGPERIHQVASNMMNTCCPSCKNDNEISFVSLQEKTEMKLKDWRSKRTQHKDSPSQVDGEPTIVSRNIVSSGGPESCEESPEGTMKITTITVSKITKRVRDLLTPPAAAPGTSEAPSQCLQGLGAGPTLCAMGFGLPLNPFMFGPAVGRTVLTVSWASLPLIVHGCNSALEDNLRSYVNKSTTRRVSRALTKTLTVSLTDSVSDELMDHMTKPSSPLITTSVKALTYGLTPALTYAVGLTITHAITREPMDDYYCWYCKHQNVYCALCRRAMELTYYRQQYTLAFAQYYSFYYARFYASDEFDLAGFLNSTSAPTG